MTYLHPFTEFQEKMETDYCYYFIKDGVASEIVFTNDYESIPKPNAIIIFKNNAAFYKNIKK